MAEADPVIASDTPATEEAPATAPKKRRWRRIALMAVVPLLLLIGGTAAVYGCVCRSCSKPNLYFLL